MPPSYPTFYNPDDLLADYVMDELYYYHGGEALSKDKFDVIISSNNNTSTFIIIHFTEYGKKVSIDIPNSQTNAKETIELALTYAHMPTIRSYLRKELPTVKIENCIITTGPNSGPLVDASGGSRHNKSTSHYTKTAYKHNGYVVYKCTHNKNTATYHIKQKNAQTGRMVWKKITFKPKN